MLICTDLGHNNVLFKSVSEMLKKERDILSVTTSSRCVLVLVNFDDNYSSKQPNNQQKLINLLLLVHGMQVANKELYLIGSKMNMTSILQEVWKIDNMNFEVTFHGKQHLK